MKYHSFVLLLCVLLNNLYGDNTVYSDPDYIRTMMEWTSEAVPVISIGDDIEYRRFLIGGMVEVRNERRFNQEIFPNHNWRGIGKFQALLLKHQRKDWQFSIYSDLRHESAHPTMGIVENTVKACEMIYDHNYRRMILNALSVGSSIIRSKAKDLFTFQGYFHFFFLSKNTPELTGSKLGEGFGISAGSQWQHTINNAPLDFYISLYGRHIFNSKKRAQGKLYSGEGSELIETVVLYPVIHHVNTISIQSGLLHQFGKKGRKAGVFLKYLYGNPFGFIDSRDKRSIASMGFEFYH